MCPMRNYYRYVLTRKQDLYYFAEEKTLKSKEYRKNIIHVMHESFVSTALSPTEMGGESDPSLFRSLI